VAPEERFANEEVAMYSEKCVVDLDLRQGGSSEGFDRGLRMENWVECRWVKEEEYRPRFET